MRPAVDRAVRDFLAKRQQELGQARPLDDVASVFDAGLLDSVSLIELVSAVESASGQTIDMLRFDPSEVESVADLVAELSAALQD